MRDEGVRSSERCADRAEEVRRPSVSGVTILTPIDIQRFWDMSAVVFDMDGVVTDTARSHAESWAAMFNEYLATREETQRAFTEEDYLR